MIPSASEEAVPSTEMAVFLLPVYGPPATATGAPLLTMTVVVSVSVSPSSSVTCSVTVYVPTAL